MARTPHPRFRVDPLPHMALILGAMLLAVVSFIRPASADTVSNEQRLVVQSIIEQQIAAFRADDGLRAYGFADPMIRRIFPSADQFMSMVRSGYQPVYRPQSYEFEGTRLAGAEIVQDVSIIGPEGRFWTATYTLRQQPDGSWKIAGCVLSQPSGADA